MTVLPCRKTLASLLALACLVGSAGAQDEPHIGYVFPAGVQQGASCVLTIGGQHLDGASAVHVTGAGIEARVTDLRKPLTQRQIGALRERITERRERARGRAAGSDAKPDSPKGPIGGYDVDSMTIDEIRALIKKFRDPKKQRNAQIAETVTVEITASRYAAPGERELRLMTDRGLSNPLKFHVGGWPELTESGDEEGQDREPLALGGVLPVTVNGQILPGDVDRYRFRAAEGERLVVAVDARELIPYLADAVPGWFQATLALYDSSGEELAYADDFRFEPDPVVCYEIPESGTYSLEIKDSIYRGREDFVYRITLGELPFVTSIFPLGGPAGEATTTTVSGWNLPQGELSVDCSSSEPGVQWVSVDSETRASNRVPFAVGDQPETLESEPNGTAASAQKVELPMIVNGLIDQPGDRDVFEFRGRSGDELVVEVFARRLHSPLDSVLRLYDSRGRELAMNDDHVDLGAGLTTHHADSRLAMRLRSRGTYYLHLEDTQGLGGPAYAYRLHIHKQQPDFELRVVPSSLNVRPGGTVAMTVHALRKDGFEGEIKLALKDPPPGFSLAGARVPANTDEVRLTLKAPARPWIAPLRLELEGRAQVGGQKIRRLAQPADDRIQAFITHHLVPADELLVSITGQRASRFTVRQVEPSLVELRPGGTAVVRFAVPKRPKVNSVEVVLDAPPEGVAIESVTMEEGRAAIVLFADAEQVEPGLRGNLIFEVYHRGLVRTSDGKERRRRLLLGTLPATPFEIGEGP